MGQGVADSHYRLQLTQARDQCGPVFNERKREPTVILLTTYIITYFRPHNHRGLPGRKPGLKGSTAEGPRVRAEEAAIIPKAVFLSSC